ncbi:MAG TPA: hypothetical protein VEX86_13015, partial [Longimicrobium sp.]|nr:hypothetical protein [Longimicrobium sp.]
MRMKQPKPRSGPEPSAAGPGSTARPDVKRLSSKPVVIAGAALLFVVLAVVFLVTSRPKPGDGPPAGPGGGAPEGPATAEFLNNEPTAAPPPGPACQGMECAASVAGGAAPGASAADSAALAAAAAQQSYGAYPAGAGATPQGTDPYAASYGPAPEESAPAAAPAAPECDRRCRYRAARGARLADGAGASTSAPASPGQQFRPGPDGLMPDAYYTALADSMMRAELSAYGSDVGAAGTAPHSGRNAAAAPQLATAPAADAGRAAPAPQAPASPSSPYVVSAGTLIPAALGYGVTNGLTVGGGFNLRRGGAAGDAFKPYVGLAFANAHGASGELQVERGGAGRASVQLLGNSRLGFQASARLDPSFRVGADSAVALEPRRYWTGDASATYRTGSGGISALRLSGHVDGHLGGGVERWSATGAVYHSGGTVEASLTDGPAVPAYLGLRGTQMLGRLFGTMPSSLSAGASLGGSGVQTADAGLSVGALGWANVSANVRWDRARSARPVLELGLSAFTRSLRVHSRVSTERGAARDRTTISARGSLAEAGLAGVTALPGPAEGSGGITGLVYYDRDADGRYTAGDSVLAGQVVQVGGLPVRTDARGRYVRWNVSPYDVAYVRIHPNAVADPALTPAQPEHRVRPVPNRALTVDFPVVQTRPVEGQVAGLADAALGG